MMKRALMLVWSMYFLTGTVAVQQSARAGYLHRGPDALRDVMDESLALNWEDSDLAKRVHIHRSNSALVSGAVAEALTLDILDELLNGTKIDDAAGTNDGIYVRTDQARYGNKDTFLFAECTAPGCNIHDETGDNDCYINWGESFMIHGGLQSGSEIKKGSKVRVQLRFKPLSHLSSSDISGQKPNVEIECAACGQICEFEAGLKKYKVDPGDCPLPAGYYDYWSRSFDLPDNLIVKALDFEQDIRTTLYDEHGKKLFSAATRISTYKKGAGGGWVK